MIDRPNHFLTGISAIAGMAGRRLPGGCDDCDAYQTLERQPNDVWGGVYVLTVHHDDGCPFLSGVTR